MFVPLQQFLITCVLVLVASSPRVKNKTIVEVLVNPDLPPQSGSFFNNPLEEESG